MEICSLNNVKKSRLQTKQMFLRYLMVWGTFFTIKEFFYKIQNISAKFLIMNIAFFKLKMWWRISKNPTISFDWWSPTGKIKLTEFTDSDSTWQKKANLILKVNFVNNFAWRCINASILTFSHRKCPIFRRLRINWEVYYNLNVVLSIQHNFMCRSSNYLF